ncbi:MAG: hypothetical protein KDA57_09920, partial [Planctomycetales bacterium]|nr:hypothetical protein [Planctomycetales bacterium]
MSSSDLSFDSMSLFRLYRSALLRVALLTILTARFTGPTLGGPFGNISIDGAFSDWDSVPAYFDADGGLGVMHTGTLIPDIHDTDHSALGDIPSYVDHPDVDILEFKFTHDASNLYAYFKADGVIGNTQTAAQGKAGRYYVIVTIDVDNDNSTGYYLHEGGYFPTSGTDRYDMNME